MDNLDRKLYEIIEKDNQGKSLYPKFVYNRVEAIKQAFKDAGYLTERERAAYLRAGVVVTYFDKPELMTGQEWYDRFEKQVLAVPLIDKHYDATLRAAKKASSIK